MIKFEVSIVVVETLVVIDQSKNQLSSKNFKNLKAKNY